jgi:UPF0755 protein
MKKNNIKFRIFIAIIAGIFILSALGVGGMYYAIAVPHNLWDSEESHREVFIHTGEGWKDLQNNVDSICPNINGAIFQFFGERMNLGNNIHPGRYEIKKEQSLLALIRRFRGATQTPISVTLPEIQYVEEALIRGSIPLEIDSNQLHEVLQIDTIWKKHPHWVIPNTYEMYWDVSPQEYLNRIYREGRSFWSQSDNKQKLEQLEFTPEEAYILASIVNRETNMIKEMDRIAGVYYNRLKINMPLQADPTIKYLLPDHVTRILYKDLEIDSPFNTYKYTGLPPGPIGLASLNSIKAVLDLEQHEYLYFCANPNQPGTHSFAKTYAEHLRNARKYHQSLNNG